jgi:hypothetical protein
VARVTILFQFLTFLPSILFAQYNVLGKPGFILAPSASEIKEAFSLGISYMPENIVFLGDQASPEGERVYHAGISVTDFFQVNLNITYAIRQPRNGIGDRHIDFRVRLLKERKNLPSLVLIAVPPGASTNYLAHNALVAGKQFADGLVEVSAGYGLPYNIGGRAVTVASKPFEIYDKREKGYWYLVGGFAGIAVHPTEWLRLSTDITNRGPAAGVGLNLKKILVGQVNWLGGNSFGYTLQTIIRLDREPSELRKAKKKQG